MAQPKPPSPSEVALTDAQTLLQMWLKVKAFLAKGLTEEPIAREEEQQFLDMKSDISKYIRTVSQKVPKDINFGADKMLELMRQSISIGHLRSLPKADKASLMQNWHQVFIYLCRAVGALQFIHEGYVPSQKGAKTSGTSLSDLKKGAGGVEKKKGGKAVKIIVFIVFFAIGFFVVRMLMGN